MKKGRADLPGCAKDERRPRVEVPHGEVENTGGPARLIRGASRQIVARESRGRSIGTISENGARPRLVSLRAAAAEVGLSIWTIRDLIGAGKLPTVQPPGVRRIFIDRKDLDRAIEAWKS